ncbi:MAG: PQQ-like beta-propeller repeat protein, partial [Actinomycetota bacterium]|nr:PQQ-like beta-propeller repeat protein [Actinomycetota bacterium]
GGGGGSAGADTPAGRDYEAGVQQLGAAEVVWRVDQGVASGAVAADDFWLTEEHLVRRLPGRVVAYDLKTGEEAWELPVGKVDDDRCPSSVEHANLRVALLVATGEGVDSACEKLVVVDIGTGEEVSTADLPPIGAEKIGGGDVPVVFGEKVVIADSAGARVLDIDDGAVLSTPDPDSACRSEKVALLGDLLLAQARCVDEGKTSIRLRSFDANLQPVWEWETPTGADGQPLPVLGVLSADPLVVEVGHTGHGAQMMRVDPESGETVPISGYTGYGGPYMSACDGWSMSVCEMAKVVGDKVILTTVPIDVNPGDPEAEPGMQASENRNELVAFDLGTGEEAWRTGIVAGRTLSLVPTDDGGVAAYQPENPNGVKAILFSVDPATGELAPLLPIGPEAHENDQLNIHLRSAAFRGDNQLAFWRDGVLVIFRAVHRDSTTGEADTVAFALPK